MKFLEGLKDILVAREPGCGYFGGAEGAIRFLIFGGVVIVAVAVWHLWP
ncbi:hypothetical protein [Salipiger mucosus]|nr:hypothetical protein [Salipiger mucosus]